jgi:hypothetical protein
VVKWLLLCREWNGKEVVNEVVGGCGGVVCWPLGTKVRMKGTSEGRRKAAAMEKEWKK